MSLSLSGVLFGRKQLILLQNMAILAETHNVEAVRTNLAMIKEPRIKQEGFSTSVILSQYGFVVAGGERIMPSTCLPMLFSPVSLYSPSHSPWISFVNPFKQTVMLHGGESAAKKVKHVRLESSSYSSVSSLKNCQPVVGGLVEPISTLVLSLGSRPSSPTSHSLPDLCWGKVKKNKKVKQMLV